MSLSAYRLFCTIAEQKNMTRAAELLHITPSAATHAMNALEKTVGLSLLNRDRAGITLTANGDLLLPRFQAVLAEEEKLHEEIGQINGLEKGLVRIGAFNSVCTSWLPKILKSFNQKYPDIEVRVFQSGYHEVESMLLNSVLDIGFVSLPTSERFSTIALSYDRLLCITPQDFTPINSSYVTPDDLRKVPLIMPSRGMDRNTQEFFESNHLELSKQHDVALDSSVVALVESGVGCSILPELVLQRTPGNYKIFPLMDNKHRTIAVATLRGRKISLANEKMIQEIRKEIDFNSTKG